MSAIMTSTKQLVLKDFGDPSSLAKTTNVKLVGSKILNFRAVLMSPLEASILKSLKKKKNYHYNSTKQKIVREYFVKKKTHTKWLLPKMSTNS